MVIEQLLSSFLQNNSLSLLTEAVSEFFDCPVIVVDDAFRIASSYASEGYDYAAYKKAVSHSELSFEASAAISDSAEKADTDVFTINRDGRKYQVSVLRVGEIVLGFMICIFDECAEASSENDMLFAASLVSKQLYFERHQSVTSTAQEILTALLNGEFSDEEHFRLRADATYLSNFNPERIALIDMSVYKNTDSKENFLSSYLKSCFHASHPFVYKDRIVMFLHKDHDLKLLEQTAINENLGITVSEKLQSLFEAGKVCEHLGEILDYLTASGRSGFMEYEHKYAVITALKKLADENCLSDDRFKRLEEYDSKLSGELCITLYTYLSCRHSLKDTCERLYTHRNTVLYRIRKIKDDFSIDLDSPKDHFRYLLVSALSLIKQGRDDLFITTD